MTLDETRDALAEMDGWTHVKQPTDEWDEDFCTITVLAIPSPVPLAILLTAGGAYPILLDSSSTMCGRSIRRRPQGRRQPFLARSASARSFRFPEHWIRASTNEVRVSHPHAPTLDGADAAVAAARCAWKRAYKFWFGMLPLFDCDGWPKEITVPDTGDKIADLYALALACRKAMGEKR